MPTVIAYATEKQAYFNLFMESCQRFGIDPVILGWEERWEGTCKKLISICDYIKDLPADEMVLSVDPFDVIFLAGMKEIEDKFRKLDTPFLCGALKLRSFNARIYKYEFNRTSLPAPENPGGYNFLNAGTWISTAGYASNLLSKMLEFDQLKACDIDQEVLTAQYVTDRTVLDIDWKCQLFQNILFSNFVTRRPNLEDIRFSGGRIINRTTDSTPSLLHASGNVVMRNIARSLGYAAHLAIPEKDMKNYFRKATFHLGKILSFTLEQWFKPFSPSSVHVRRAGSS
jgi:hypothetical protein